MSINERRRYLKRVAPRYGRANKADWGCLLAKMTAATGLHRKSLIRLVNIPTSSNIYWLERASGRARTQSGGHGKGLQESARK